jgi:hypothetical protein
MDSSGVYTLDCPDNINWIWLSQAAQPASIVAYPEVFPPTKISQGLFVRYGKVPGVSPPSAVAIAFAIAWTWGVGAAAPRPRKERITCDPLNED